MDEPYSIPGTRASLSPTCPCPCPCPPSALETRVRPCPPSAPESKEGGFFLDGDLREENCACSKACGQEGVLRTEGSSEDRREGVVW